MARKKFRVMCGGSVYSYRRLSNALTMVSVLDGLYGLGAARLVVAGW